MAGDAAASAGPGVVRVDFWRTLIRAAWLAIALGVLLQVLLLTVDAGFGVSGGMGPLVAETLRSVAWSEIVCVGLAAGRVASSARPEFSGLTGLLAAPLGFNAANAVQKGVAEALDVAQPAAGGVSPLLIAFIKGLEYGSLGLLLAWLGRRIGTRARTYAAAGLAVGLVFGGGIIALFTAASAQPLSPAQLIARSANELLFPVGCALVVYAATGIGRYSAASE